MSRVYGIVVPLKSKMAQGVTSDLEQAKSLASFIVGAVVVDFLDFQEGWPGMSEQLLAEALGWAP